jgi:large subunit ribosomal protein L29
MKIEKFREMSQDELKHKLTELQDSLFKLRIKVQTKQVENTSQVAATRHDIARIRTLLRAAEQKAAPASPTAKSAAAAEGKK